MGSKPNQQTRLRGVVAGGSPYSLEPGSQHIGSVNTILREEDHLQARFGIKRMRTTSLSDRLIPFGNQILVHHPSGAVEAFNSADLTVTPTSVGSYTDPGYRAQHASAGRRLFITAADGLISFGWWVGELRIAGGPVAPGPRGTPSPSGTSGWLVAGQHVAYRYTLGLVLPDGTQVIGPPSGRFDVEQVGGGPGTPALSLVVPPGLTESHFIQVWRSSSVPIGIAPDDDMRLVFERNINKKEIAQLFVLVSDLVPDALRGEYIYTAPNAGEGIGQANSPPPLAQGVALFKDRLWLSNTRQPNEFFFKILGVGTGGMAAGDRIMITSQSPALVMTEGVDFTVSTALSASENVRRTAESLAYGINFKYGNISVWAESVSGPDDSLGEVRIFCRDVASDTVFDVFTDQRSGLGAWTNPLAFAPALPPYLQGGFAARTFSLQRAANVVTATISAGNLTNALVVGDRIGIGNPSGGFGSGPHEVTAVAATTFSYAEVAANAGPTAGFSVSFVADDLARSVAEQFSNRLHFSKPLEFEAFPRGDFMDIGSASAEIICVRNTRDTLWVFKQDGLFRVTGDDPSNFTVERMDSTIVAVSAECVRASAEALIAWTTKGVVRISESSFDMISSDVDQLLREYLIASGPISGDPNQGRLSQCFMVADDLDGTIRLHLSGGSRNAEGDTSGAGEALVFSLKTQTWARWAWQGAVSGYPLAIYDAIVDPATSRIVMCCQTNALAGEGYLWRERRWAEANAWEDDREDVPASAPGRHLVLRRTVFAAATAGAPMRDKRFDEVALLFAMRTWPLGTPTMPGVFTFGFGNENQESTDGNLIFGLKRTAVWPLATTPSQPPRSPSVRISVPSRFARGQRLWVVVEDQSESEFGLHGFAVQSEVLNASITR